MRRRELMLLLGGAVIVWPLAGHAQQPERLRLGVLMLFREHDPNTQPFVMAFAQALERFGWVEGKNIRIDYRFATGDRTLYKTYAAELIGHRTQFWQTALRLSGHCGSRHARYRSFS